MCLASVCVWIGDKDSFTEDLGAQGLQGVECVLTGHGLILQLIMDGSLVRDFRLLCW